MKYSIIFMFALVALAFAHEAAEKTNVVELGDDTFDAFVAENKAVMVVFYAPWCGHCKNLLPTYHEASLSPELEGKAKFAMIDATENEKLASRFEVRGYPTIKIVIDGEAMDYEGARSKDALIKGVLSNIGPAFVELSTEEEIAEFTKQNLAVLAKLESNSGKAFKNFEKVAKRLRAKFSFAYTTGNDEVSVELFKDNEETAKFTKKITSKALEAFLKTNQLPLFGEVGPENFRDYMEAGLPIIFGFLNPEEDNEEFMTVMQNIAVEFKGKLSIVWADGVRHVRQAEYIGLTGTVLPAVGFAENDDHYPLMPEDEPITFERVKEFLQSFLDGELEPFIKSEPVPEDNDEAVFTLVGDSFLDVVHDKSKNVFVKFYAPWCGHCKALAPKWVELGEYFEDRDDVIIAEMDMTKNDAKGVSVRGFPTLLMFPAGKDVPSGIAYEGDREVEALIEFVEEHAGEAPKKASNKDEL